MNGLYGHQLYYKDNVRQLARVVTYMNPCTTSVHARDKGVDANPLFSNMMCQQGTLSAPYMDNIPLTLVLDNFNRPVAVKVLTKVLTVPANFAKNNVIRKHLGAVVGDRM